MTIAFVHKQAAEKCSIRIRASLQRCRNWCKISSAFRRCGSQYHFFSSLAGSPNREPIYR